MRAPTIKKKLAMSQTTPQSTVVSDWWLIVMVKIRDMIRPKTAGFRPNRLERTAREPRTK